MAIIPKIPCPANAETPREPRYSRCVSSQQVFAKEAAGRLSMAFTWSETAEGMDFWTQVCKRLEQIGRDGILKVLS